MKTTNCLIILLSALCLAGCKFDGSLISEKYTFDSSNAMRISINNDSYSLISDDSPKIESVIINYAQNREIENVVIKLQGKLSKRYDASILQWPYSSYNVGHYFCGQWKTLKEYDTIIGGNLWAISRIMNNSPDIHLKLDEEFLEDIRVGYLNKYHKSLYLIYIKKGEFGSGAWYVYPVIREQERRNLDLIPEKKSYFN